MIFSCRYNRKRCIYYKVFVSPLQTCSSNPEPLGFYFWNLASTPIKDVRKVPKKDSEYIRLNIGRKVFSNIPFRHFFFHINFYIVWLRDVYNSHISQVRKYVMFEVLFFKSIFTHFLLFLYAVFIYVVFLCLIL